MPAAEIEAAVIDPLRGILWQSLPGLVHEIAGAEGRRSA
jgi:hypothetical protein